MTAPVFTTYALFPREALRQLVKQLMYPMQVQWQGDPQKFVGPLLGKPGARIELDVLGVRELGTNEVRTQFDTVNTANLVTIAQQQVYVITFTCNSWSFDTPAHDTLTQMHLRLRRSGSLEALREMGISMGRRGRIVDLDLAADTRPIYSAVAEYEFNFAAVETDETDAGGIIQYVNADPNHLDPAHPVGEIPDVPPMDPKVGN